MSNTRFIVFDVETPNRYNNRMSAIGISVVESGKCRQPSKQASIDRIPGHVKT